MLRQTICLIASCSFTQTVVRKIRLFFKNSKICKEKNPNYTFILTMTTQEKSINPGQEKLGIWTRSY